MSPIPVRFPFFSLRQCFLASVILSGLWGGAAHSAQLNYDNDGSSTNGITEGTSAGWNTSSQPWYNPVGGTFSTWPNTDADIAVFGGGTSGTAGTVTVGTVTANGIIFNTPFAGTYTLSSGTITLAGTTPTITVNTTQATISSVLTGTAGLTKTGLSTGNLTLSGSAANTYSGTTYVSGGNLTLNKTAGVNAVGGDIVINGGVLIWGATNQVPDTASITLLSGGLQIANMTDTIANLTISGGNANNNTSSNSGFFTITGTLAINGTSNLGMNSGGQWTVNKADFTGAPGTALSLTGNSNVRFTQFNVGSGGLILTGTTISLNKGTSTTNAFGSELVLNGNVTASGNNNISMGGTYGAARLNLPIVSTWDITAGTTNINVSTFGAGGLTKTGAGSLALAGGTEANTHTGMTTVSGGSLILAKTAGTNAIAGDVTVATGGILDWNAANQLADTSNVFLTGGSLKFDGFTETFASLTQTAGTINYNGDTNGGAVFITGQLRISGGNTMTMNSSAVWSVGSADFSGFSGTVLSLNANSDTVLNQFIVGSGGLTLSGQSINLNKGTITGARGSELTLNGDVTASGNNNFNVGTNTIGVGQINLGTANRTWTITSGTTASNANVVGNGGGIIKAGSGVLAFNTVNTYTGNTVINGGTFRLGASGSIDTSPRITVANGATFDVALVSGYSVKNGQRLEGGGSVSGSLTIANGALLAPGILGGNEAQKLTISGALTLSSGSQTIFDLSGPGSYDQIAVGTSFTQATGAKIVVSANDFVPAAGQSYNLFDWGTLGGLSTNLGATYRDGSDDDATDLNLPSLVGTGFMWDLSQFASSGIISVVLVPEPSRMFLLILAGMIALGRRRRNG